MNWIPRFGLLVVVQGVSLWAHSQSTFQKLLPDLKPEWGQYCVHPVTGGLTFTSTAHDQFGTSGDDIALVSLNNEGDTLWSRVYGRSFADRCHSLTATADGGYLITGSTASTNALPTRVFLIRTDAQGDTLWTRAYGNTDYDFGWSAIQCLDGGFLVLGWNRLYMIRIDAQGDLLWSKTYDYLFPPPRL